MSSSETMEEIDQVIKSFNNGDMKFDISKILTELKENPNKLQEIMNQYPDKTAEIQGAIVEAIQKGVISPEKVKKDYMKSARNKREKVKTRKELIKEQKQYKKEMAEQNRRIRSEMNLVNVVLVNNSRKLKLKQVSEQIVWMEIKRLLHAKKIAAFDCPRLCEGTLSDKSITVVCDSALVGKRGNKRSTRLTGHPFSGELVIYSPGYSLSVKEIEAVEKKVSSKPMKQLEKIEIPDDNPLCEELDEYPDEIPQHPQMNREEEFVPYEIEEEDPMDLLEENKEESCDPELEKLIQQVKDFEEK